MMSFALDKHVLVQPLSWPTFKIILKLGFFLKDWVFAWTIPFSLPFD